MAKVINLIPDWDKKQNTCFFCKTNKSVKYMLSCCGQDYPVCNTCMLKIATILWKGKKEKKKMNGTFEVIKAYIGNLRIKAYENGDCILDIILHDYDVDGACQVLEALGYSLLRREY